MPCHCGRSKESLRFIASVAKQSPVKSKYKVCFRSEMMSSCLINKESLRVIASVAKQSPGRQGHCFTADSDSRTRG